jgi:SAM-dependent methyltransferase
MLPESSNGPQQAPFDAIATEYDATFTDTAVGRMQREIVRSVTRPFLSGGLALELNCGTGADAVWLASQGYRVLATDISPAMTAITRQKADLAGYNDAISVQTAGIHEISTRPPGESFDLIFSNFGGLNCVPPEDLAQLGQSLPKLLQPGGCLIAVVMGRFCWWETVYFLLKARPGAAFRRLSRKPVPARLDDSTTVDTWYYSPRQLKSMLTNTNLPNYTTTLHPIGCFLPPSYLNPFFEKRPRLLNFLFKLEQHYRASCWAFCADHYLLIFHPTPQNQ